MSRKLAGRRRHERDEEPEIEGAVASIHLVPRGEGLEVVLENPGGVDDEALVQYLEAAAEQIGKTADRSSGLF